VRAGSAEVGERPAKRPTREAASPGSGSSAAPDAAPPQQHATQQARAAASPGPLAAAGPLGAPVAPAPVAPAPVAPAPVAPALGAPVAPVWPAASPQRLPSLYATGRTAAPAPALAAASATGAAPTARAARAVPDRQANSSLAAQILQRLHGMGQDTVPPRHC